MTDSAVLVVHAPSLDDATRTAEAVFRAYYGDRPFSFSSSARPSVEQVGVMVPELWEVEFVATRDPTVQFGAVDEPGDWPLRDSAR